VSHDENFKFLRRADTGSTAVELGETKTELFQLVRTSLLPGVLNTVKSNKAMPLPIRTFELSDVVLKDPKNEVGARNERRLAAIYGAAASAGFEVSAAAHTGSVQC
jgi:phenylalanyl-tRNA synthetase beta chain